MGAKYDNKTPSRKIPLVWNIKDGNILSYTTEHIICRRHFAYLAHTGILFSRFVRFFSITRWRFFLTGKLKTIQVCLVFGSRLLPSRIFLVLRRTANKIFHVYSYIQHSGPIIPCLFSDKNIFIAYVRHKLFVGVFVVSFASWNSSLITNEINDTSWNYV